MSYPPPYPPLPNQPPPNQAPPNLPPPAQQPLYQPPGHLPYASWQQPPSEKHSPFGIASFIIGVLTGVMELALVIVAGVMTQQHASQQAIGIDGCGILLGILTALAGVALGVVTVVRSDRKKLFGIIGLCINGLILLGVLGLLVLGLAMR